MRSNVGPSVGDLDASEADGRLPFRILTLCLGDYAWDAISAEAVREGLSVEELVTFGVLYYLADVDSGRIARRIPGSPHRPRSAHLRG